MLMNIKLRNFKCFKNEEFSLKPLTMLAGTNGSGKSSVIQAILLMKQGYDKYGDFSRCIISGNYVKIGKSNDILYDYIVDDKNIEISLKYSSGNEYKVILEYIADKNLLFNKVENTTFFEGDNIISGKIEYISADRLSPENMHPTLVDSNNLGTHGEYALYYLESNRSQKVCNEMMLDDYPDDIASQVDAWLNYIFTGFRARFSEIPGTDSIKLRFQEISKTDVGNEHRPINVGYGLSHIIPIITALLKSKKDDLVIIENPENNLHPRAQTLIGELIARATNAGVQVIVETHSDHIINSTRVCVSKEILPKNNVQILFFSRENFGDRFETSVSSTEIYENGSFSKWPSGFLDEWDNALLKLLR